MAKKSALGKGLGALLSDAAEEAKPRGTASSALQEELKLCDIRPNPNQPRTVARVGLFNQGYRHRATHHREGSGRREVRDCCRGT